MPLFIDSGLASSAAAAAFDFFAVETACSPQYFFAASVLYTSHLLVSTAAGVASPLTTSLW